MYQAVIINYPRMTDDGLEIRGAFLDISKVFDKVCHESLITKLKQNGISGYLLHMLSDVFE